MLELNKRGTVSLVLGFFYSMVSDGAGILSRSQSIVTSPRTTRLETKDWREAKDARTGSRRPLNRSRTVLELTGSVCDSSRL